MCQKDDCLSATIGVCCYIRIPFQLTQKARLWLATERLVETDVTCDHTWTMVGRKLVCEHCGFERDLPRSSSQVSPHRYGRGGS